MMTYSRSQSVPVHRFSPYHQHIRVQRSKSVPLTEVERQEAHPESPKSPPPSPTYEEYEPQPPSPPLSPPSVLLRPCGSGSEYPDPLEATYQTSGASSEPYYIQDNQPLLEHSTCPSVPHERSFFCGDNCVAPEDSLVAGFHDNPLPSIETSPSEDTSEEDSNSDDDEDEEGLDAASLYLLRESKKMEIMARNTIYSRHCPKAKSLRQLNSFQRKRSLATNLLRGMSKERLQSTSRKDAYNLYGKARFEELRKVRRSRYGEEKWGQHTVMKRSRLVKELWWDEKYQVMRTKIHEGRGVNIVAELEESCVCGCLAKTGQLCKRRRWGFE